MKQLRPYQSEGIDHIADKYSSGKRKLLFQLPTGAGKTVTASGLIHRYLSKTNRKVVFVVHRDELLTQFRSTLYSQHGIIAEPITAGVKYRNPNAQVYVAMVETANNRLKKRPQFFGDVGLVIIDEAHLGNFMKIHEYFPTALIVGLTATPISANKSFPLNKQYEDIVCPTDIPDLIAIGALCPNQTYVVKSVNRASLEVVNGEFDNRKMGYEYGKTKHVKNCIEGYERHSLGQKTLIFNCNIEHSLKVTEAFCAAGYPAKHLDGTMKDEDRKAVIRWFATTPDAILCNIAVLTAGFDEPSARTVIVNRSTKSLSLWLQMTGRGSRPSPGKAVFTIIDMGGNAIEHGDWSQSRDWEYIFHHLKQKKGTREGVAPIKVCVNDRCEAVISANAKVCQFCGVAQPVDEVLYDNSKVEFELLASQIDVPHIIQQAQVAGYNPYASLHQIKAMLVQKARDQSRKMDDTRAYLLLASFQHLVEKWCRENGKQYNNWHKTTTADWFFQELKRVFNYERQHLSISL